MSSLHSTFRFIEGRLVKCEPPEWFAKATVEDIDWPAQLQRAGVIGIEEFDSGGESLEIFQAQSGEYFIGHWDAAKCVVGIFIDSAADYFVFRATYIAPLASLIMEMERHGEWRKGRKFKAVS